VTSEVAPTEAEMMITKTGVGAKRETLAERFAAYLETAAGPADVGILVRSFELSLRAANKSPKTIKSYSDTVRGFCLFPDGHGMPTDVRRLMREPYRRFSSTS
jgi:hypothetical protein